VRKFAEKWGGLGLCKHGLPWNHGALWGHGNEGVRLKSSGTDRPISIAGDPETWVVNPKFCVPSADRFDDGQWLVEPLQAWIDYSLAVLAIRNTAWRGRQKKSPEQWAVERLENLCYGTAGAAAHFKQLAGDEALPVTSRHEVLQLVQDRLYTWTLGAPLVHAFEITGNWKSQKDDYLVDCRFGVFPAIATQLSFLICDPKGVAECANCGKLFCLDREPSIKRLVFCRACGKKASQKFASRKYRKNT
jgi:hypothetical protein